MFGRFATLTLLRFLVTPAVTADVVEYCPVNEPNLIVCIDPIVSTPTTIPFVTGFLDQANIKAYVASCTLPAPLTFVTVALLEVEYGSPGPGVGPMCAALGGTCGLPTPPPPGEPCAIGFVPVDEDVTYADTTTVQVIDGDLTAKTIGGVGIGPVTVTIVDLHEAWHHSVMLASNYACDGGQFLFGPDNVVCPGDDS